MSRALLVVTVALASYSLFNIVVSILVAAAWRGWLVHRSAASSTQRARTLIQLRSVPVLVAAAITFAVVIPAFSIFEPERASETVGPVVLMLAAIAAAQLTASIAMAASMIRRTRDAARAWLRNSVPLE